jgi:hypothetical protein
MGCDDDEGRTEPRNANLLIRIVPRSFLRNSGTTFNRCWGATQDRACRPTILVVGLAHSRFAKDDRLGRDSED